VHTHEELAVVALFVLAIDRVARHPPTGVHTCQGSPVITVAHPDWPSTHSINEIEALCGFIALKVDVFLYLMHS